MSRIYPLAKKGLAIREAYMEAIHDETCTHIIIYSEEYGNEWLRILHHDLRKNHFKLFNTIGTKEVWKHIVRANSVPYTNPITLPDHWREVNYYEMREGAKCSNND